MKMKKFLALSTASVMALSMVACGSTDNGAAESTASNTPATAEASTVVATEADETTGLNYAELTLGEDYTDITTTIKVLTNRTDLLEDGAAVLKVSPTMQVIRCFVCRVVTGAML